MYKEWRMCMLQHTTRHTSSTRPAARCNQVAAHTRRDGDAQRTSNSNKHAEMLTPALPNNNASFDPPSDSSVTGLPAAQHTSPLHAYDTPMWVQSNIARCQVPRTIIPDSAACRRACMHRGWLAPTVPVQGALEVTGASTAYGAASQQAAVTHARCCSTRRGWGARESCEAWSALCELVPRRAMHPLPRRSAVFQAWREGGERSGGQTQAERTNHMHIEAGRTRQEKTIVFSSMTSLC